MSRSLAVIAASIMLSSVLGTPAMAHGDGFAAHCDYGASGPDQAGHTVVGRGETSCDYQHNRNKVFVALLFSNSGDAGTFRVIKDNWDSTRNSRYGKAEVTANACRFGGGDGYYKVRMKGRIYNDSGVLVHWGWRAQGRGYYRACIG